MRSAPQKLRAEGRRVCQRRAGAGFAGHAETARHVPAQAEHGLLQRGLPAARRKGGTGRQYLVARGRRDRAGRRRRPREEAAQLLQHRGARRRGAGGGAAGAAGGGEELRRAGAEQRARREEERGGEGGHGRGAGEDRGGLVAECG